ncbi:MAG TPA: hypothetical protein VE399_09905 [Gemmatimonadales bacterium]|jgi:hypothetical protein|nr:hypothetical protein [Gemmatimonadales bacterium]
MHAWFKKVLTGTTALLFVGSSSAVAQVGLPSNVATVALTATKNATLTVSPNASTATLASITDNSNVNNFTPVSLTTAWNLTAGSTVRLIGWFATPAQALANGTDFIPSSKVEGRVNATAYAPFTSGAVAGVGVAGGSLQLFSQAVAAGSYFGSRTDQLDLRLDLTGTTTVAGDYTGTLNLQAIVQ